MFGGQQQRTGFGFGAAASAPAFGSQPSTGGFGGFGTAATAPNASPFGAPAAAASPFGGGANTTPAFGSSFGAPSATTSAFGAPASGTPVGFGGFGSTTTTTSFGAPAQPAASPFGAPAAQPAASPFGGGMFGGAAAAKPSGFGGFGAASPAATPSAFGTTTSGFGAPATNAFGGQSTLGGGGFGGTAFGAPAAAPASGFGSNPFGQPTPATTGAFGAPAAQTGFGGFGAAPATGQALVGTGPPASYKPTSEQETEKGKMTTVHFQSISKMPEYQHKSAEELRWEDYLKRTDPAAAQAQAALVPNTGGAAPAATNMFGQPSTTAASAFGKPPLGGGFGQAAAPATGGFGGGFGAPAAPSAFGGGGGFGSSNTSFGAPAAAPTTTSFSFGNNAAAGTGTGGGFGGFGATPSNAFGTPSTTAASTTTGGGFGGFGQPAAPATTSAFGAPQATTTTGGFGGFGAKPATTSGAFGTTTGGFGGFGSAPAATPATTTTGGGFGGGFGSTPSSGFGGGFGKPAAAAPSAFGSSFGSTPAAATGSSAFGGFGSTSNAFSLNTSAQPGGAAASSAFNFGKPASTATPSLFGSAATSSFMPFGSSSSSAAPSSFGTTAANTATNAGMFGGGSSFGGGGFGAPGGTTTAQQQQQPTTLFAGHDTNPYGTGSYGAGLIEKQIQTTLTLPVPTSGAASSQSSLFPASLSVYGGTAATRDDRPVKPITTAAGLRFHPSPASTAAATRAALSSLETPTADSTTTTSSSSSSFATSKFKSLATKQLTINTPPPKLTRPTDKPQVIPEAITLTFVVSSDSSSSPSRPIRWTGDADTTLDAVWPVVASQVKPAKLVRWRQSDGAPLSLDATVGSVDTSAPIEVDVVDTSAGGPHVPAAASSSDLSFDRFYEKEVEKESACHAVNPLAPVLTKEGYYTLPDYDTLCTLSTGDLKAVDHFVVGCKGMGCVQWYGSTDVTGLNLDELVLFAPKEVIVYPNEDDKHPLGEGLNKPALVELLHIYPPDDPAKRAAYVNRVKARTDHMDATYVDYQPDAGVWKFKVEHFSRYGFDDDEDDENSHHMTTENPPNTLQTMAAKLKLNPARLHQLQALYLKQTIPHAAPVSMTTDMQEEDIGKSPSIFGSFPLSERPAASTSLSSATHPTRLVVVEPVTPPPPAPAAPRRYAVPPPSRQQGSPTLALWNGPNTSTLDMGISFGRSFRGASFGPSGQLVVVTRHRHVRVYAHPIATPATADSLPLLAVHQSLSKTNDYHVTLPSDLSAHVHEYADNAVAATSMWQLVVALYGLEPPRPDDDRGGRSTRGHPSEHPPLSPSQRDEFISRWFERAIRRRHHPLPPSQSKPTSEKTVLQALLQHNVVAAAQRAMAQGNAHLAMLVAQASSYNGSSFRQQLESQLSQWEDQAASRHVDKSLLEVYSILAGNVGVVTKRATSPSCSMDWIQMLALVLWYHKGPTSLPNALGVYHSFVQQGWAKPAVDTATMKPDVLFELMQLYCDAKTSLTSVLSALPDDIAWHLNALLSSVPSQSLRLSPKAHTLLTRHYLSHLVADDQHISHALYVAMTLENDVERQATARAILERHITASTPLEPLEAIVPSTWIQHALALHALAEHQYQAAIEHYLRAGDWSRAHDVLIEHVVFPALFRQDTGGVLEVLEGYLEPHSFEIAHWTKYGQVVLSYLRLRNSREGATVEDVVALGDQLLLWQANPLHVLSDNPTEAAAVARACLSSMLTYTTEVALLLHPPPSLSADSGRHGVWLLDRLQAFVQPDCFGEAFRAKLLVRACATFD
ncbi:hypothetical protein H257_09740 [Aphanomyces astaci]|uniref:Peptidase S59 domain-containing protein n=2 Tax=Aphanomyces astaci TaxID=112090 RepID=W4G974_APHAT|nr:hypothetical protein H257_09740 [Aphanomyces astaci]ETV76247.1 hypothetical protein H257_09740 [Aphanomyces astaci]|eukprot:XP_009834372.1 hypothetical protein H257_09740 [Aphanomyces astaci]